MSKIYNICLLVVVFTVSSLFTACQSKRNPNWEYAPQMYRSIAYESDQKNSVFEDGKTAQVPVIGTIPQGFEVFHYPNTNAGYEMADKKLHSPLVANQANIAVGKRLYLSMCSHCHGKTGLSDGAVVTNGGFPSPPAYNSAQLKSISEGKMFFSITYGKGAMGSHASQLSKDERWKIIQYIQVLQQQ